MIFIAGMIKIPDIHLKSKTSAIAEVLLKK